MDLMFLDSNIYLDFYRTNGHEYRKLIDALLKLGESVFIPGHLPDEVRRNQGKVSLEFFTNNYGWRQKNGPLPNITIPVHLGREEDCRKWNRLYDEMRQKFSRELSDLMQQLWESVITCKDALTHTLEENLFNRAEKASEEEVTRAKERKERGNPPGKKNDPLGDQLAWEQILTKYSSGQKLWLVSKDQDFFVGTKGNWHLNPFLERDLRNKTGDEPQVRCHDNLREALEAFKRETPTLEIQVPSEEEIVTTPSGIGVPIFLPSGSVFFSGAGPTITFADQPTGGVFISGTGANIPFVAQPSGVFFSGAGPTITFADQPTGGVFVGEKKPAGDPGDDNQSE